MSPTCWELTQGEALKRHGAQSVEDFRAEGYIPEALVNFLAWLGWAYDDKTEVFSREDLVRLFSLDRVSSSPAVFDYEKLAWLNGVHLRNLPPEEYADRVLAFLRERGSDWDEELVRQAAPLVQEKIETLSQFPDYVRFLFEEIEPDPALLDNRVLEAAAETLADWSRSTRRRLSPAGLAERLEPSRARRFSRSEWRSPGRRSHRVSSRASSCSAGKSLARLQCCARRKGLGGPRGSSARWKSIQARRRKLAVGCGSWAASRCWTSSAFPDSGRRPAFKP